MKKALSLVILGMFAIGYFIPSFAETTDTNSRPQRPQFENGQRPQMNGENGQNGQFDGRRPKYKPDSQPGGKMEPKEWDNSSGSGQGFQGKEPPQFDKNGRPPKPPKEENANNASE